MAVATRSGTDVGRSRPTRGWILTEWSSLALFCLVVNFPLFSAIAMFLGKSPQERIGENLGGMVFVFALVFSPILAVAILVLVGIPLARDGLAVFARVAATAFVAAAIFGILVSEQTYNFGDYVWLTMVIVTGIGATIVLIWSLLTWKLRSERKGGPRTGVQVGETVGPRGG